MIIEERQRDIGQFLVGRLLPFRQKRQVGPFTFIDHMGPVQIGPGSYFDIDQHPHIGLSTLTYLIEGQIEHRDSTGAVQLITPGDVGFMTAGKGVAHTERTPGAWRDGRSRRLQGYQVWVALPVGKEEMDPEFSFIPREGLPCWESDGLSFRLVAGEAFGRTSPLKVYSPLFMVDLEAHRDVGLDLGGELAGEIALVVTKGKVKDRGETIHPGQMMIAKSEETCRIHLARNSRIILFGGEPLPEERFLYWNFVSSSKDRIELAKQQWADKAFPRVPGDDTYIPLPPV